MVTEWGQGVSPGKKQEERWDLSFTCQEAGIASAWHGVHSESACTSSGRHNKGKKIALEKKNKCNSSFYNAEKKDLKNLTYLREELKTHANLFGDFSSA